MNETNISWTEWADENGIVRKGYTWNPVSGCTKVSPGCQNCYAEAWSHRWHRSFDVTLHPERLSQISRIPSGTKVFVNSMSDLFHDKVLVPYKRYAWEWESPYEFLEGVFRAMAFRPDVTFQILTKRPENLLKFWLHLIDKYGANEITEWSKTQGKHIWLGVSVEMKQYAHRIVSLRAVPGFTKFVSFEPLIGDIGNIDLTGIKWIIIGGECIAKGTRIATKNGPKSIESLTEDDEVISCDYSITSDQPSYKIQHRVKAETVYSHIKHLSLAGIKESLILDTNTRQIQCSEDHKFLRLTIEKIKFEQRIRHRYSFEWVPLKYIRKGDLILISKSIPDNGVPFNLPEPYGQTSEEFMTIIGAFLGDGWIRLRERRRSEVSFALPEGSNKRNVLLPLLIKFFGKVSTQDPRGIQVHIYKNEVAKLFCNLDLNKKALQKRIPAWCWGLPKSQREALLQGYLITDGTIEKATGRWKFESPNKELIEDFYQLALTIGLPATIVRSRKRTRGDWKSNNGINYHYDESESFYFSISPLGNQHKSFNDISARPIMRSLKNTNFTLEKVYSISPPSCFIQTETPCSFACLMRLRVHSSFIGRWCGPELCVTIPFAM